MLKGPWTKFKWMVATILAPELILGKAVGDFVAARRHRRKMRPLAARDGVPWSLNHSYYAQMGGFVVRARTAAITVAVDSDPGNEINSNKAADSEVQPVAEQEAQTEAQQAVQAVQAEEELKAEGTTEDTIQTLAPRRLGIEDFPVLIQSTRETRPTELLQYDIIGHLPATRLLQLRERNFLKVIPNLSEDEINDKSKSDIFTKFIAAGQVLWISVEIIARVARGLSISQLELATSGFSACAVIIYILNLKKPQGEQTPTTFLCCVQVPSLVDAVRGPGLLPIYTIFDALFDIGVPNVRVTTNIRNDEIEEKTSLWTFGGAALGGVIFGGIHIGAWDFVFPTFVDQMLWRSASVLAAAVLPVTFVGFWGEGGLYSVTGSQIYAALMFLYIIARLILLVEIFRTLCFLPPDAYINTWASNIPSIG
jgi:hypothetical protein